MPVIAPVRLAESTRFRESVVAKPSATSPEMEPDVPPAPIWRPPALTAVPPVYVLSPESTSVPVPVLERPAEPATSAAIVAVAPGTTSTSLTSRVAPESVNGPPATT